MLAVIAITLVIIAACVSYEIVQLPVLESREIIQVKPSVLQQTCSQVHTKNLNTTLGMYNISVRKTTSGYSGLIRGCTWNGCVKDNESPSFSYPYRVVLDSTGALDNLERIELDYDNLTNCRCKFRDVYANGIEDPKLFMFQGEEWAIANCLGSLQQQHPCVNTMCIFKISDPRNTFRLLKCPTSVDPLQAQKNWSPFQWEENLLCEYTLQPHVILNIDTETGITTELYTSELASATKLKHIDSCSDRTSSNLTSNIITKRGSLRGGAPPILIERDRICLRNINFMDEDSFFLGIGHSIPSKDIGYVHFFYTFNASPPFNITNISKFFKLDKKEHIQFVAGLSQANRNIYVSYGVNDCTNRIARYTIDDILDLLEI